jgi:hypothetical protein
MDYTIIGNEVNLAARLESLAEVGGILMAHETHSLVNGRFRDSDILRHLFETVVRRCMSEGLVGGEGFAVDASLIQADANKQRSIPSSEWSIEDIPARSTQAVRDYLASLDDEAFGAASPTVPRFISPSDPASQWTPRHNLVTFPSLPIQTRMYYLVMHE